MGYLGKIIQSIQQLFQGAHRKEPLMSSAVDRTGVVSHIKNGIQSCGINFLMGSGLSRPYLITLGNIEGLLEALSQDKTADEPTKNLIRLSLYKRYFEAVMLKNCSWYSRVGDDQKSYDHVVKAYEEFLLALNNIVLHRDNVLIGKQINLFTTNIDLFLEGALESKNLEFNDGFKGRIIPKFSLSNFRRAYFKTSLHYENKAELPVFNLFKLHGSINWQEGDGDSPYICLATLEYMRAIQDALSEIGEKFLIDMSENDSLADLKRKVLAIRDVPDEVKIQKFFNEYSKLRIVNPTKEKFATTLFDSIYYEQLRMFANELEKENSMLFVMGFSFADEHISEITLRVANSNPTLKIFVLAFDSKVKEQIKTNIHIATNINNNIFIITPEEVSPSSKKEDIQFTYSEMNRLIFCPLSKMVSDKSSSFARKD